MARETVRPIIIFATYAAFALTGTGCVSFTHHAIPAYRLPQQFEAPSRCNLSPINFAMLGQNQPPEYILGSGDIIGVAIQGIVPPKAEEVAPIIQGQMAINREYYPSNGSIHAPAIGLPLTVDSRGDLALPLIRPVPVGGLTLHVAAELIRKAYIDKQLVKEGNDRVNLTIIKARVHRVLVLREDASLESANFIAKTQTVLHKRGSGTVVDLPVYESDVLHALIASGGLPGVDAYNEIWVLRKAGLNPEVVEQLQHSSDRGQSPAEIIDNTPTHLRAIRVPLKLCPGEPIPFSPQDVVLHDGDLVYIEPRRDEYFYTGGLLPGGQITIPRDEDLDVLEAIALANGSVGGPGGASSAVFRAGAGPGFIVPPRRALILRKTPDGGQLPIRVDLARAMRNPAERIGIMPGDFIMLYYTPGEMVSNVALNLFNFNYAIK